MTYREQVMETTKLACQDIINRIEELVPDTEGVISTEIHIRIPTMTDKADSIPTCELHMEVYPKMRTVEKIIAAMNQVPVASTEVLLASFDLTHGKDNRLCIVGKKDGDKGAITIVNTFDGQDAEDIFKLLSTTDHEKKPWSENHGRYHCPYCNSEFDDNLPYVCKTPDFHMPKYCPDCGKLILMNQEEQGQEHQV